MVRVCDGSLAATPRAMTGNNGSTTDAASDVGRVPAGFGVSGAGANGFVPWFNVSGIGASVFVPGFGVPGTGAGKFVPVVGVPGTGAGKFVPGFGVPGGGAGGFVPGFGVPGANAAPKVAPNLLHSFFNFSKF